MPVPAKRSIASFNTTLFVMSGFIFFSTFSYWFVSSDSPASLINVFVRKNLQDKVTPSQASWVLFYLHAVVTAMGLLFYYKSDLPQWLGRKISTQRTVARWFFGKNDVVKLITQIFKIIMGAALLYAAYNILITLAEGYIPPYAGCTLFIILFFVATSGWYVQYPEPEIRTDFSGPLDCRNSTLWLRIGDTQIAYIQDRQNRDQWGLTRSRREVDLSYTEAYLLTEKSFSNYLRELIISEDITGKLKYSLRLEPIFGNFPEKLSTDKLQSLYNKFTNAQEIEKIIFLSVKNGPLLKRVKNETFQGLNKYFDTQSSILENQNTKLNDDFDRIMKQYADYGSISAEINAEIESEIEDILGHKKLFRISFEVTKTEFNIDEMLKEVIHSRKATGHTMAEGNIKMQGEIMQALVKVATTPGLSEKKFGSMMDFASKMNTLFAGNTNGGAHGEVVEESPLISPLAQACDNVLSAVFEMMETDATPDVVAEAISRSTPFIANNNIPLEAFVKRFFQKMSDERQDRTAEAYRKLVEDTFLEFINRK